MISFRSGGFDFNTAPSGVAGTVIPYTAAMTILQNGLVGIGTTTPTNRLTVAGTGDFFQVNSDFLFVQSVHNGQIATIKNTNGTSKTDGLYITTGSNSTNGAWFINFLRPDGTQIGEIEQNSATSVGYFTTSDKRLKNIMEGTQMGLPNLMKIKVYDYTFKSDANKKVLTGFIAQELYEIFPQAVSKPRDSNEPAEKNPWMVDYGSVTPLIIKSVQEQQQIIDELKKSNDDLKNQNENLKERIIKLESALAAITANNGNIANVVATASLEQNKPNPFNKNSIIRYNIPQGTKGQINIYDQAGKLIKTLKANADGQSQLNSHDLAAGAYTYALMVDGKITLSKQMLIIK